MSDTWAAKAEENIELFTSTGKGAEAARMLEVSPANRIFIDTEQTIIMQIGRLMQGRFMNLKPAKGKAIIVPGQSPVNIPEKINKYEWVKVVLDNVEYHQANIDGRTRSDFKEVAIAQGIGALKSKVKGEIENLMVK
jgi:hypothetical protein